MNFKNENAKLNIALALLEDEDTVNLIVYVWKQKNEGRLSAQGW